LNENAFGRGSTAANGSRRVQGKDEKQLETALKMSFSIATARLVSGGKLVAFALASSDESLNATIWDVVVDPQLPDEVRAAHPARILAWV